MIKAKLMLSVYKLTMLRISRQTSVKFRAILPQNCSSFLNGAFLNMKLNLEFDIMSGLHLMTIKLDHESSQRYQKPLLQQMAQ